MNHWFRSVNRRESNRFCRWRPRPSMARYSVLPRSNCSLPLPIRG